MKDEIFKKPIKKQFEFDENVASVFDDMISRSVPFYDECLDLICDVLNLYLKKDAKVIDLGCSTAKLLISLAQKRDDLSLIGVDNSNAMLKIAQNKINAFGLNNRISLFEDDILNYDFSANCAILNYTLQFIRPIKRAEFVKKIYDNLQNNSVLIFSEKLIYDDAVLNKNMIEIYLAYKEKQGYSKYEIAQKREALENVLIPYSEKENKTLMENAGFKNIEVLFKWANFAVFIAFKD